MKSPNILSIERYPICRQPDVLTDGNAIIIPDSDCVKPENYKKDLELSYLSGVYQLRRFFIDGGVAGIAFLPVYVFSASLLFLFCGSFGLRGGGGIVSNFFLQVSFPLVAELLHGAAGSFLPQFLVIFALASGDI